MTTEELAAAGLRYDVDGPVATITLDRPEVHNAQTPRMWRALAAIGADITDGVRVVLVRGAGRSFSAGLDRALLEPLGAGSGPGPGPGQGASQGAGDGVESVAAMMSLPGEEMSTVIDAFQGSFTFLRDPRFVSVAVVQGHAIGAGFQLALSCDLRVVCDDVRFAMVETTLGLVPDLTGTKPLVECVGYARALEICTTGREIGAAEAAAIGLATVVCRSDELDGTVDDLVGALTAPPAGAVRETKRLLLGASSRTLDEQRRHEREAQIRRFRELSQTMRG